MFKMDFVLEDLWRSYLEDKHSIPSLEHKIALGVMEQIENNLRNTLNDEEKAILDDLMNASGDLKATYGKECFIKGIRFATKYLLEATE